MPQEVLSLPVAIQEYQSYSPVLQGKTNQSSFEAYYFVSTTKSFNHKKLAKKKIGVVGLLGRKKMLEYMQEIFNEDISIKRVLRSSDLLPLLRFKLVDAIFISESNLNILKTTTKLKLYYNNSDKKIKRPQLAVLNKTNQSVFIQCVLRFDYSLNRFFDVETWEIM